MPNRLIEETSPYLLQHADNPVDWHPWGTEALDRANRENKPIFLSIGYAACHWCHVMAHESFEDIHIASFLNLNFINIKVDREERPDIDSIYMEAVVAMTGQGGWPMSVFLTPDGKPFFAGTYFPPSPRYGMPSFRQVIEGLVQVWESNQSQAFEIGDQIVEHMEKAAQKPLKNQNLELIDLNLPTNTLIQSYDKVYGGWGQAPKFPQPMAIEFLIRQVVRGNQEAINLVKHTLNAMAKGGLFDVLGGGFHRYSTDNHWLIPHFEKMLYDNAQLAQVYLHAYLLTKDEYYLDICTLTLDFVLREMTDRSGGFYSSLDADSEGVEGKYYVWSYDELQTLFPKKQDFELLKAAYNITQNGNFEGKIALQRAKSNLDLAKQFHLEENRVSQWIRELNSKLFEVRQKRKRPMTDDKILVSWNALMMVAFAEAGRYLKRTDYLEVAERNASFILDSLYHDNRLLRSWRDGKARHNAYLEDYAALIIGLLSLYQSDFNVHWFSTALNLSAEMVEHFSDPKGGFYDSREDHDPLIIRPKDIQDNATPSGNSMAAYALLLLDAFSEQGDIRYRTEEVLGSIFSNASRYPTSFGFWLCGLDFASGPVKQLAILYQDRVETVLEMVDLILKTYRPHLVLAISKYPPLPTAPLLVQDRPLVRGDPSAFVCENYTCQQPVNSVQGLENQLNSHPPFRE